jgi:hypothetical protein
MVYHNMEHINNPYLGNSLLVSAANRHFKTHSREPRMDTKSRHYVVRLAQLDRFLPPRYGANIHLFPALYLALLICNNYAKKVRS